VEKFGFLFFSFMHKKLLEVFKDDFFFLEKFSKLSEDYIAVVPRVMAMLSSIVDYLSPCVFAKEVSDFTKQLQPVMDALIVLKNRAFLQDEIVAISKELIKNKALPQGFFSKFNDLVSPLVFANSFYEDYEAPELFFPSEDSDFLYQEDFIEDYEAPELFFPPAQDEDADSLEKSLALHPAYKIPNKLDAGLIQIFFPPLRSIEDWLNFNIDAVNIFQYIFTVESRKNFMQNTDWKTFYPNFSEPTFKADFQVPFFKEPNIIPSHVHYSKTDMDLLISGLDLNKKINSRFF